MASPEKSTERLPLDARLLSRAIIELNIARRVISLYPGSHHLVQAALDRAYDTFISLFELRGEITLAVAKDTLLIDEYFLDRKNPVFREFALALSRLSIASITFIKGVSREEVYAFHRLLSREEGGVSAEALTELVKESRLRYIQVDPLDYRKLSFQEGKTQKGGEDPRLLERYLKGFLDGTLAPGDVDMIVEEVPPEILAQMMGEAAPGAGHPEAYDTVISSYLRSARTPRYSGSDLGRLFSFINGLRPELKKEFLTASVRNLGRDHETLEHALEGVSVDSVIALLGSINESNLALPTTLRSLLSKFAQFGLATPGKSQGALENLADDFLLSPELTSLLREEEAPGLNPESYREEIRQLIEANLSRGPRGASEPPDPGWGEDFVRYSYGQSLVEVLASPDAGLISAVQYQQFTGVLCELADKTVTDGQYQQFHELLGQLLDLREQGRNPGIVGPVLAHCDSREFIEAFVASLHDHGRASRVTATALCWHYGVRIIPALYDLLAIESSRSVRRFLIGLLIHAGDAVKSESLRRLPDRRWFVRRNVLYVLAEAGVAGAASIIRSRCRDADARVRLEAARCLLLAGDEHGVRTLREMLHGDDAAAARMAVSLAGGLRVRELAPDLVELLRRKVLRGKDYQAKIPYIRALSRIGDPRAEPALHEVLAERSFLFQQDLTKLKKEAAAALRALRAAAGGGAAGRDEEHDG